MIIHTELVYRLLRWSAVSAIVALVLMVWGIFDPHPISLVIAMSIGQALGTASFAVFCFVVFIDLRRSRIFSRVAARFSTAPPRNSSIRPPPPEARG
jgi:hypothetical protein